MTPPPRINFWHRSRARRLIVQALYQSIINDIPINEAAGTVLAARSVRKVDVAYFHQIMDGILAQSTHLPTIIAPLLDREWLRLDPVTRAILLLAAYEMVQCTDTPHAVVINESIELARQYGATEKTYKYVNAVVDHLARRYRSPNPVVST